MELRGGGDITLWNIDKCFINQIDRRNPIVLFEPDWCLKRLHELLRSPGLWNGSEISEQRHFRVVCRSVWLRKCCMDMSVWKTRRGKSNGHSTAAPYGQLALRIENVNTKMPKLRPGSLYNTNKWIHIETLSPPTHLSGVFVSVWGCNSITFRGKSNGVKNPCVCVQYELLSVSQSLDYIT